MLYWWLKPSYICVLFLLKGKEPTDVFLQQFNTSLTTGKQKYISPPQLALAAFNECQIYPSITVFIILDSKIKSTIYSEIWLSEPYAGKPASLPSIEACLTGTSTLHQVCISGHQFISLHSVQVHFKSKNINRFFSNGDMWELQTVFTCSRLFVSNKYFYDEEILANFIFIKIKPYLHILWLKILPIFENLCGVLRFVAYIVKIL